MENLKWLDITLKNISRFFGENLSAKIGYLGDTKIIDILKEKDFIKNLKFMLFDPVMGDNGLYYPFINYEYKNKLKGLINYADILTPNLTELCFLADEVYDVNMSFSEIEFLVSKLYLKPEAKVIVTGIKKKDKIFCYYHDKLSSKFYSTDLIKGHFYGMGDAFSTMILVFLLKNKSIGESIPFIMKLMDKVVRDTLNRQKDVKLGIDIKSLLRNNF